MSDSDSDSFVETPMEQYYRIHGPRLDEIARNRRREQSEAQIARDQRLAEQLQQQEENMLLNASIRSANERRPGGRVPDTTIPVIPPVVPSEHDSDLDDSNTYGYGTRTQPIQIPRPRRTSTTWASASASARPPPAPSAGRRLDINGAYSPDGPTGHIPLMVYNPPAHPTPPADPPAPAAASQPRSRPQVTVQPLRSALRNPNRQPVIPPVVPSPTSSTSDDHPRSHGRSQTPYPYHTRPVIPPVIPSPPTNRASAQTPDPYNRPAYRGAAAGAGGRSATPAPRPYEHWYPRGYAAPTMHPPPSQQQAYYPQLWPQNSAPVIPPPPTSGPAPVIPAPPIAPPVRRPPHQGFFVDIPALPPVEPPVVPFIPPSPESLGVSAATNINTSANAKPGPRPILKPKPASAVISAQKAGGRTEGDGKERRDSLRKRRSAVFEEPPSEDEGEGSSETLAEEESKEEEELEEEEGATEGPLRELRAHVKLFTGSFKCTNCGTLMKIKPIHTSITSTSPLPPLAPSLPLSCPSCKTLHCRGRQHLSHCKRTCAGPSPPPSSSSCLLTSCCRAGRAIALFTILSLFDAKFLALYHASPCTSYVDYTKRAILSSAPSARTPPALSELLLWTLKALIPWLPLEHPPVAGSHSSAGSTRNKDKAPHVHESALPLLQVSLLLDVLRMYLRAPRDRWVCPGNGEVYKAILEFLERVKDAGGGRVKGLVCGRRVRVDETRGVGAIVWGWAEGGAGGTGKGRRWRTGMDVEGFVEMLKGGKALRDIKTMKDGVRKEGAKGPKGELLQDLLAELFRWQLSGLLM
ncbi:hypothetical protein DXG01_015576 [Tephrocybe rancida]|nr:hypothetical protein DXG01_015576 [Tephrocybe rancida]